MLYSYNQQMSSCSPRKTEVIRRSSHKFPFPPQQTKHHQTQTSVSPSSTVDWSCPLTGPLIYWNSKYCLSHTLRALVSLISLAASCFFSLCLYISFLSCKRSSTNRLCNLKSATSLVFFKFQFFTH